jgi:hypothetical protein
MASSVPASENVQKLVIKKATSIADTLLVSACRERAEVILGIEADREISEIPLSSGAVGSKLMMYQVTSKYFWGGKLTSGNFPFRSKSLLILVVLFNLIPTFDTWMGRNYKQRLFSARKLQRE